MQPGFTGFEKNSENAFSPDESAHRELSIEWSRQ
jgi:hypothetical protein